MSRRTEKRKSPSDAAAPAKSAAAPAVSSKRGKTAPAPHSIGTKYYRVASSGTRGEVFTFGSGDCSQLGHGADENMRERKKPTPVKELAEFNCVAASAGSLHNAVIDDHGAVLTWGCNDDFALGHEEDEWYPHRVVGPLGDGQTKVRQVLCGSSHTVALTDDGAVYAWGSYRDAQGLMGFSETVEQAKQPLPLKNLTKVVQIAAGDDHDLALTASGEVYQWGDIGFGQRFSDRNKKTKLVPRLVVFKKSGKHAKPKIVAVYAGGHGSYAISEEGTVWAWGPNNYCQLGLKNPDKDHISVLVPTPIPDLPPVAKVAAGTHHSIFLTKDGRVFSVGRGEDGRLGHGVGENVEHPKQIEGLIISGDRVIDISCSESHSMAVTEKGKLYTFGYGDLLQLGNGVEEDILAPYLVTSRALDDENRMVLQASAGSQHSIILAAHREQPKHEKKEAKEEKKVEKGTPKGKKSDPAPETASTSGPSALSSATKSGDFDSQVSAADEAEMPPDDDGF